jgi:hypothetical protein
VRSAGVTRRGILGVSGLGMVVYGRVSDTGVEEVRLVRACTGLRFDVLGIIEL